MFQIRPRVSCLRLDLVSHVSDYTSCLVFQIRPRVSCFRLDPVSRVSNWTPCLVFQIRPRVSCFRENMRRSVSLSKSSGCILGRNRRVGWSGDFSFTLVYPCVVGLFRLSPMFVLVWLFWLP